MNSLSEVGFLRLPQIVGTPASKATPARPGLFPVSRSTWWAWVKSGKAPQPIKLSPGCTVWRESDVRAFAESLAGGAQ